MPRPSRATRWRSSKLPAKRARRDPAASTSPPFASAPGSRWRSIASFADRPNVYARLPGAERGRPLLLNGHVDTIPRGDSDPPEMRDGWVVGRGAEDMKGGLVAMVHAAVALRRAGVRLGSDLWLTGVVGHETPVGKKEGPKRLVERIRAGDIPAAAVIIAEGPHAIWTAGLGAAMFGITLSSARGIVHTLHVPFAHNPARWAGAILEELAEWEARFEAEAPHPLCGRQRVDIGLVAGGDYPEPSADAPHLAGHAPLAARPHGGRRGGRAARPVPAHRGTLGAGRDVLPGCAPRALRDAGRSPAGARPGGRGDDRHRRRVAPDWIGPGDRRQHLCHRRVAAGGLLRSPSTPRPTPTMSACRSSACTGPPRCTP